MSQSINVDFEVQNVDKVNTLIDLLSKRIDELPSDIVVALKSLADCEHCEVNNKKLIQMGVDGKVTITCDGKEVRGVVSTNTVLKRITVYKCMFDGVSDRPDFDGKHGFLESFEYPKSFKLVDDQSGKTIIEW